MLVSCINPALNKLGLARIIVPPLISGNWPRPETQRDKERL